MHTSSNIPALLIKGIEAASILAKDTLSSKHLVGPFCGDILVQCSRRQVVKLILLDGSTTLETRLAPQWKFKSRLAVA